MSTVSSAQSRTTSVGETPPTCTVVALGVAIELVIDDVVVRQPVLKLLVDIAAPTSSERDEVVKVTGSGPWRISSAAFDLDVHDVPATLSAVMTAINLTAIKRTTTLSFHCGVVARNGSALVIPAVSGTGKTTLVTALLQRGWDYISDEALCTSWDHLVARPYPRPLALSAWSTQTLDVTGVRGANEVFVLPRDLGATLAGPSPVGHLIVLHRDDEAPRLAAVSPVEVAAELLHRSFTHFQNPPLALAHVAKLVSSATTHRLHLGDPRRAADLLSERLV